MRCCYLINPFSGGRLGDRILQRLSDLPIVTQQRGAVLALDPAHIAAQVSNASDFDAIIVGGGDGSVFQLLPHLLTFSGKVGLLPLGTANDLARELHIPRASEKNLEALVAHLQRAVSKKLSVWQLRAGAQQVLFSNYLSFGYDAAVIRTVNRWRYEQGLPFSPSSVFKMRLAYALAALKHYPDRLAGTIEIGNEFERVMHCGLRGILFSNICAIMGMARSNCSGSPFDDRIEVQTIPHLGRYFAMAAKRIVPWPEVVASSQQWTIKGIDRTMPLQADGESLAEIGAEECTISQAGSIEILSF